MFGRNGNAQRTQPALAMPPREPHPSTAAFLDEHNRLREENAYLTDENEGLRQDYKVLTEQHRLQALDLANIKRERDKFQRYAVSIRKSLRTIKLLIDEEEAEAQANALQEPEEQPNDAALHAAIEKAVAEVMPEEQP